MRVKTELICQTRNLIKKNERFPEAYSIVCSLRQSVNHNTFTRAFCHYMKIKIKVEQKSCPFNQSRKIVFLSIHDIKRQYKILQVGNGWFFHPHRKQNIMEV